jgi:hypothetical protein
MIANAYAMNFPAFYTTSSSVKKAAPKPTGVMSKPIHGAVLLVVSLVMLVSLDGFLGIGFLSLLLTGKKYDWEAAFSPILKKLGIELASLSSLSPRRSNDVELDEAERQGLVSETAINS